MASVEHVDHSVYVSISTIKSDTRDWESLLDPDMKEEFFLTVYLSCVNPEVKGGWTERPRLFIMSLM